MAHHLLDDDLVEQEIVLVPASKEKRLANFFLDYFAIILLVVFFYAVLEIMGYPIDAGNDTLAERLQGMIFYLTYYLTAEGIASGKSLGKIITKTRVVTSSGAPPEVANILKRSLARLVPFEPFSFLGQSHLGWHDKWSDTMVIDEELSVLK